MSDADLIAVVLTLKLAGLTTLVLMLFGLPYAWWLANTRTRFRSLFEAATALPLVLPPTVLGFYLLVTMGAGGVVGQMWVAWFGQPLAFSFTGLVVASCLYSLPFVVQPMQAAFAALPRDTIEVAWTLGATRLKTFFTIVLPQCKSGLLVALVLGFAHTVGEFGVVLMVGGNIPGETQVISVSVYEHVEAMDYGKAHVLAAGLLVVSLTTLTLLYASGGGKVRRALA